MGFQRSSDARISASTHFDTLIKNGLVYDGTGAAPVKADVGIKGGKITAIGNLGDSATRLLDAGDMAVSPGFVDIHTHTDTKLLVCPQGDSRIYQGITSDVGGNCGGSPFPGRHNRYADLDDFFAELEKKKIGINFATYTGHGDIREAIVGANDIKPSADQMEQMKRLLQRTLDQGSFGMSTGLEYAPGSYALEEELAELCKVVAKNGGLYATHLRNEDDRVEEAVTEAIATARRAGVALQISHLKAQNQANWHKAPNLLKMIEEASAAGVNVMFDRYPYVAFSTGLTSFMPLWARQGSSQEWIARLKDKATAARIDEYAASRIKRLGGGKNIVVTSGRTAENRKYIGKNLEECADISGKGMLQFIREILVEESLGVDMIGFAMSEDNIRLLLSHPLSMPASDGSVASPAGPLSQNMPHPRSYGTFPRFLGKYCRDEGILSLPEAIKKITSVPANRIGLKHRGQIQIGYHADIVVFDPGTIIDMASFTNPHQFGPGINHVLVNGEWAIRNGKHTGVLAGQVLRRGGG